MMTNDDERGEGGGKKCPKFDDVICERPLIDNRPDRKFTEHVKLGPVISRNM